MKNIVSSWRKPCRKIIFENVFPKFMILQCNPFVKDNTFVQRYCHLQRDLHCKITDFERFYFENNFPTRFSPRRNNIFHSFLFFIFVCIFTIQKNTNPIIIIKSGRTNICVGATWFFCERDTIKYLHSF